MRGQPLLELDDLRREALLAATEVIAWPRALRPRAIELRAVPAREARARPVPSADPRIEAGLAALLERWIAMQVELDRLDAQVGDGDTGSTFARAAKQVRTRSSELPFADPPALLAELARQLGECMGGSSGVLLSIACTAASQALERRLDWPAALAEAVARIQEYGGARAGDRTMLDALVPALAALREGGDVHAAARAARLGAAQTASLAQAKAGRAAYLSSASLIGVEDPGAIAIAGAFEAIADALGPG